MSGEVAAPPAETCWRCRGVGSRLAKAPRTGDAASAPVTVACCACAGSGSIARSAPRAGGSRATKTVEGWVPAGPPPHARVPVVLGEHEDLCAFTGRWRVVQRTDAHRYSTDDLLTAWVASRVARARGLLAPRTADIGCGLGSVLLSTAWLLPRAVCVGVEAQATRYALAVRNMDCNMGGDGDAPRCAIIHGDLRDASTASLLSTASCALRPRLSAAAATASAVAVAEAGDEACAIFDIVTGTPPYFDVAAGGTPSHEESARCLFEYRGGIEAYTLAASSLLAPHGTFVVCETALELARTYAAAAAAQLRVVARVDVIPRIGKPPLFCVFCMIRDVGDGVAGSGSSTAASQLDEHAFEPLPQSELPYADMREPAYALYLKQREAAETVFNSGGPSASRTRQAPRGLHVTLCGKPFYAPPQTPEHVHVVTVRGLGGVRTAAYARLLWELGMPG